MSEVVSNPEGSLSKIEINISDFSVVSWVEGIFSCEQVEFLSIVMVHVVPSFGLFSIIEFNETICLLLNLRVSEIDEVPFCVST